MARTQRTAAVLLLLALLATSLLSALAAGINQGRGVQFEQFRPEYQASIEPTEREQLRAEYRQRGSSVLGRKLLQGVLGCDGQVGICGTQAANSGFTAGEFVQSGGGYGAGNGIGDASAGRRGNSRGGGRGGRARGGGAAGRR